MTTNSQKIFSFSIFALSLALAGCGGSGSDNVANAESNIAANQLAAADGLSALKNANLTDVSIRFADIATEVGLGSHQANGTTIHGPGSIFADLNNDGFPDIYAVDRSGNDLYINESSADGVRVFTRFVGAAGANPCLLYTSPSPRDRG